MRKIEDRYRFMVWLGSLVMLVLEVINFGSILRAIEEVLNYGNVFEFVLVCLCLLCPFAGFFVLSVKMYRD